MTKAKTKTRGITKTKPEAKTPRSKLAPTRRNAAAALLGGAGGFLLADHLAARTQQRTTVQVQRGFDDIVKRLQQVDDRVAQVAQLPPRTLEGAFENVEAQALETMPPRQQLYGIPVMTKDDIVDRIAGVVDGFGLLAAGIGTTKIALLRGLVRDAAGKDKRFDSVLETIVRFRAAGVLGYSGRAVLWSLGQARVGTALMLTLSKSPENQKVVQAMNILRLDPNTLLKMLADLAAFAGLAANCIAREQPTVDVSWFFVRDMANKMDEYTLQLLYACLVFLVAAQASVEQAAQMYPGYNFPLICTSVFQVGNDPTPLPHPVLQVLQTLDAVPTTSTYDSWCGLPRPPKTPPRTVRTHTRGSSLSSSNAYRSNAQLRANGGGNNRANGGGNNRANGGGNNRANGRNDSSFNIDTARRRSNAQSRTNAGT